MKDIYRTYGIYRITNKMNGNSYIGKTGMNFGDRWDCHRAQLNGGYHDNPHLQHAWDKYGADAFEFAIVEVVSDIEQLNDLEKKYISEYRLAGKSYNIHDGGDGGLLLGKHLSDDTKKKIGEKNRVNMTGKKASPETRRRMSESQSKRYKEWTEADREAWGLLSKSCATGYRWSDDARKRFSELQQTKPNGAKFSADDIRKIRALWADGIAGKELAEMFETTPSYISSIVHRRRWANID